MWVFKMEAPDDQWGPVAGTYERVINFLNIWATISTSRVTSLHVVLFGHEAAAVERKETAEQSCEVLHTGSYRFALQSAYLWVAKERLSTFNGTIW